MARRRYLSTQISTDARVARIASEAGVFAALLYTWMIPHAGDDGLITGDPDELQLLVVPGLREYTAMDVRGAIEHMLSLGLLEQLDGRLAFPEEPFYQHQSYIRAEKRRQSPENAANHRESPPNAAECRQSPGNAASPSLSLSPSPSGEENARSPDPDVRAREAAPEDEPEPETFSQDVLDTAEILSQCAWVGDELPVVQRQVERAFGLVPEFRTRDGPFNAEQYGRWPKHHKKPPADWYRAWLNWLKQAVKITARDGPQAVDYRNHPMYQPPVFVRDTPEYAASPQDKYFARTDDQR